MPPVVHLVCFWEKAGTKGIPVRLEMAFARSWTQYRWGHRLAEGGAVIIRS
jgi:hypothetical protein